MFPRRDFLPLDHKICLTSGETPDRVLVFPGCATTYQIVELLCFARQLYGLFSLSSNHDQKPSDKYFISFGLHLEAHTLSRLSHNTNHKPCNVITARKRCVMENNPIWLHCSCNHPPCFLIWNVRAWWRFAAAKIRIICFLIARSKTYSCFPSLYPHFVCPSISGSNKTKAPIMSDISLAALCTRQSLWHF